ncbi:MAG: SGNH/GDSL hydrolase family protein [Monoglobaceae bacterium]
MKRIRIFLAFLLSVVLPTASMVTVSAAEYNYLTQEELLKILSGYVYYTVDTDGYTDLESFTPAQSSYYISKGEFYRQFVENEQTLISFVTNTTSFRFDYKLEGTYGYLDVYVDGTCQSSKNVSGMSSSGAYTYSLDGSEHQIDIYLPRNGMKIKNFAYQSGYLKPVENRVKVMFYGDSITYGYGHDRPSVDYVSTLARLMNYEVVNYGVGGYYFDGGQVIAQELFKPDIIFVAYGANDANRPRSVVKDSIKAFMDNLRELYPTQKIYVITPLWANDNATRIENLPFVRNAITSVCSSAAYGDVTIIDGLPLVPNENAYFLDKIHPNEEGNRIYAENLVPYVTPEAEIVNASVDRGQKRISWEISEGKYSGADIFMLKENGKFKKVASVTDKREYICEETGIYAVKRIGDEGLITESELLCVESENTLTLSVSNVKISGDAVNCTAAYKNNSENFAKAVICAEALDKNGEVLSYHYRSVCIGAGAEKSFNVYLGAKGAERIRISAVDTKKAGNAVAETVVLQSMDRE